MHLTSALVGLFALSASAATISARQDPVIFTYQVGQESSCSTIDWNLSDFHQSQLPASGCVSISSLVDSSAAAASFILVETPGICRVVMYEDANCSGLGNPVLTSLHCANGPFRSFRVEGTGKGC